MKYALVSLILAGGMFYAVYFNKLTIAAAVAGAVIAVVLFSASGFGGLALMTTFFLLGSLATSFKKDIKQQYGMVEENKGKRTTGQVLANAGMAGAIGVEHIINPGNPVVCLVLIAAVFSAATADTLSSELGMIYGKRFYNIITLKKEQRGLDGVISVEGTLLGIAGSLVIAGIYLLFNASFMYAAVIVVAGTFGNLLDSFLGASLERKHVVNNNAVNFFNTAFAVAVAWGLIKIIQ